MRDVVGWLTHPLRSWDRLQAELVARDEAVAAANGWTVEVLPGGRRRYRDPRFDQLHARRPAQLDRLPGHYPTPTQAWVRPQPQHWSCAGGRNEVPVTAVVLVMQVDCRHGP